jgi:hypothetical protein
MVPHRANRLLLQTDVAMTRLSRARERARRERERETEGSFSDSGVQTASQAEVEQEALWRELQAKRVECDHLRAQSTSLLQVVQLVVTKTADEVHVAQDTSPLPHVAVGPSPPPALPSAAELVDDLLVVLPIVDALCKGPPRQKLSTVAPKLHEKEPSTRQLIGGAKKLSWWVKRHPEYFSLQEEGVNGDNKYITLADPPTLELKLLMAFREVTTRHAATSARMETAQTLPLTASNLGENETVSGETVRDSSGATSAVTLDPCAHARERLVERSLTRRQLQHVKKHAPEQNWTLQTRWKVTFEDITMITDHSRRVAITAWASEDESSWEKLQPLFLDVDLSEATAYDKALSKYVAKASLFTMLTLVKWALLIAQSR